MSNEQQRVDVLSKIRAACDSDALPYEVYCGVAELIEAMRPFAELAELFDDEMRGGNMPKADADPIMQWPRVSKEYELRVGHLRDARTALAAVEGQP